MAQGQSPRSDETADDGGGSVSPRPTARYRNPRPRPHAANCQIWRHSEKSELLGPKVKGQMGNSKANI